MRIKKLNLEPLFHQLILVNHDQTSTVQFSIDGVPSPAKDVPSGGLGWSKYYLDGTVVGLHDASGVVQTRYLLKRSISFVFESGGWRGQFEGGQPYNPVALEFLNHATAFFNQPVNPQAQQGASQFSVLLAIYTFMYDFTLWANECPHFDDHYTGGNPPSPSSLPEYIMLRNQGQNGGNIDNFSGLGGLLK